MDNILVCKETFLYTGQGISIVFKEGIQYKIKSFDNKRYSIFVEHSDGELYRFSTTEGIEFIYPLISDHFESIHKARKRKLETI